MPIERTGHLKYWASKRTIIGLALPSGWIRLCHVLFGSDGSIYVDWPDFRFTDGILSVVRLDEQGQTSNTVEFLNHGKVTSHLVKFSHHPDGRVHFSQSGRVRPQVFRNSRFPLDGLCLGAALLYGLSAILDREQFNNHICQATLTYLFMSARFGYETYVLPEERFKELVKQLSSEEQKVVKGNPFMLRAENQPAATHLGYFTDYRVRADSSGTRIKIDGERYWKLLQLFKKNSAKISARSGFAEYVQTKIASLNQRPISE